MNGSEGLGNGGWVMEMNAVGRVKAWEVGEFRGGGGILKRS